MLLCICCTVVVMGGMFVVAGALPTPVPMNTNMLENVKKCKNFLSTLIKLASGQPANTVKNVKELIQGLIVSISFIFSPGLKNYSLAPNIRGCRQSEHLWSQFHGSSTRIVAGATITEL